MNQSVSVVIPSYNGLHLLKKHLPAVLACVRTDDEVIICDDAGSDLTSKWLIESFGLKPVSLAKLLDPDKLPDPQSSPDLANSPDHTNLPDPASPPDFSQFTGTVTRAGKTITLTFIQNHTNLRFAATCNRAVTLATRPLIFLLNNDVSPHADVLSHLVPYFADPQMFAVGCLEHENASAIDDDGETVAPVWGGKNKLRFARGMFVHARATAYTTGATAWVSGGSGLFSRAKWLELGGFDVAYYPAYWEDVDVSYRARQRGWKVWFEAKARVDHHHESTNQDVFGQSKIDRISWRNAQLFTWKNGTWWQRLQFVGWWPYYAWKRARL